MKQISTLLFAALASYVHVSSAVSDASFYGCYSNSGSLQPKATDEFQSRGACRGTCTASPGYSVQAMTNGTVCLCGNHLPNDQYKVDDAKCKQYCPGFKDETCGTRLGDYFSVYLTGLEESPDQDPASTSSTDHPTTTPGNQPTSTHSGPTTTTDPRATATSSSTPKKSVSTARVAAGVVIGLLVLAGACSFAYILIRRRNRRQVEEEYKRSAAAREFAKHPIQDHRLDPVMAQRRDSAGSIADNQDFSRRILKVTNPDDR